MCRHILRIAWAPVRVSISVHIHNVCLPVKRDKATVPRKGTWRLHEKGVERETGGFRRKRLRAGLRRNCQPSTNTNVPRTLQVLTTSVSSTHPIQVFFFIGHAGLAFAVLALAFHAALFVCLTRLETLSAACMLPCRLVVVLSMPGRLARPRRPVDWGCFLYFSLPLYGVFGFSMFFTSSSSTTSRSAALARSPAQANPCLRGAFPEEHKYRYFYKPPIRFLRTTSYIGQPKLGFLGSPRLLARPLELAIVSGRPAGASLTAGTLPSSAALRPKGESPNAAETAAVLVLPAGAVRRSCLLRLILLFCLSVCLPLWARLCRKQRPLAHSRPKRAELARPSAVGRLLTRRRSPSI